MSRSGSSGDGRQCQVCGGDRIALFSRAKGGENAIWEVLQCTTCHFGWTQPQPDPGELSSYYPVDYLGDVEKTLLEFRRGTLQGSRSWRRETGKVKVVQRYCGGGRLLDVGCAGASFLLALDPGRWQRFGVEPIGEVVDIVTRLAPGVRIEKGTMFSSSLQEQSFDAVTLWHVFEHLPEPLEALKRAHALLKPGGIVVISLPNLDSYQARLFTHHWYGLDVPRHLHHFSPRALEVFFSRAGFSLLDHLLFCPLANQHQLKHSALRWSLEKWGSRIPYYLLKPALLGLPVLERLTGQFGTLTSVGRKPPNGDPEAV